jgi:hypothetical protein
VSVASGYSLNQGLPCQFNYVMVGVNQEPISNRYLLVAEGKVLAIIKVFEFISDFKLTSIY